MEHIFITYNQINFFTSCLQLSKKKKKAVEISFASYRDSRITRTKPPNIFMQYFCFQEANSIQKQKTSSRTNTGKFPNIKRNCLGHSV